MKVKLISVGDGLGTMLLPIPHSMMTLLGWEDGDEVVLDIPVTGPGSIILHKPDVPKTRLVATPSTDKSREIK